MVPLNTNAQLLWYRKDLVKTPPKTWAQMIPMAKKLPSSDGLIEEQGQEYEGYTVWFNSLDASAGGQVVNANGNPVLGKPAVVAAQTILDVAKSGRADPSLSTDQEDQGRLTFEAGKAAFMVNWPYVYAAARTDAKTSAVTKKVFQNLGWAPYPAIYPNVPGRSSVGGANIGVSKYGPNPALAEQAAICMTRPYWQNQEAINEGLPPVTSTPTPTRRWSRPIRSRRCCSTSSSTPPPARRRRCTRTFRWRSNRRCIRRPASTPLRTSAS